MKITAIAIKDFKRIKDIRIEPGETSLVVIGGNNGQGKSSLIDSLTSAFGGKRQTCPRPVRNGAKHAEIKVVLDGGDLTVKRRISAEGVHTLEVYDESGKKKAPQRILDELVGARFLDPLTFLRLSDKEQRKALIDCTSWPEGFKYGRWLLEYDEAFTERTEIKRTAKHLAAIAEAAESERPAEIPSAPDVAELVAELQALKDRQREQSDAIDAAGVAKSRAESCSAAAERQQELVERATQRLDELKREMCESIDAARDAMTAAETLDPDALNGDIEEANAAIAGATEKQEAHRVAVAAVAAADRAADESDIAAEQVKCFDASVKELRQAFDVAWADAKTPISDVSWDDSQVLLGGVPYQQASDAEQLRAALSIASAMSPGLGDIWVKDGSLLDEKSIGLVREFAEENDRRVWIERVGESDADAIIIREGALVVEEVAKAS